MTIQYVEHFDVVEIYPTFCTWKFLNTFAVIFFILTNLWSMKYYVKKAFFIYLVIRVGTVGTTVRWGEQDWFGISKQFIIYQTWARPPVSNGSFQNSCTLAGSLRLTVTFLGADGISTKCKLKKLGSTKEKYAIKPRK